MTNIAASAVRGVLGLVLASGVSGAAPGSAAPAASIPPDVAPHVPRDIRSYFLVFLVTPPSPRDMPHELFVRHQAYMRSQFEQGAFRLAGPVPDGGRIRGMLIVDAASADDAAAIVAADPAVQASVFALEVHPVRLPSLDGFKVEYPAPQR